jgi:hypothetical protein
VMTIASRMPNPATSSKPDTDPTPTPSHRDRHKHMQATPQSLILLRGGTFFLPYGSTASKSSRVKATSRMIAVRWWLFMQGAVLGVRDVVFFEPSSMSGECRVVIQQRAVMLKGRNCIRRKINGRYWKSSLW